jgi:hypothetical protein
VRYKMWKDSSFRKPHFLPVDESVNLIRDLPPGHVNYVVQAGIGETPLSTFPPIYQFRVKRLNTITKGR